jgi:type IV pilus assembly protein PilC
MEFNPVLFSRVSEIDRVLFAKHLSLMSRSGIPLSEAIETLIAQTKSPYFKKILGRILGDLENGQSLSKALSKHPKVFNAFYTNLIEIGEKSGNLSQNLDYLAKQLTKNLEFRAKVRAATLYPAIVLSLAFVVSLGVSIFALPKLIDVFSGFDVTLPLSTRMLIGFSVVVRDYGILILIALFLLAGIFRGLLKFPAFRIVWEKILLKMPVIGSVIRNSQTSLLCRGLGAMTQGGVPILTALQIQKNNTSNLVYRDYLEHMVVSVNKGGTISGLIATKEYRDFPPIVEKILGVGEKSGNLDESLIYLADYFEGEVDEAAKNISTVLEPLLLFIISAVVAFIALAIITPIYQLTGSIK